LFDPNWTRWIVASVQKHFDLRAAPNNIPTLYEGDDISAVKDQIKYVEIRVNGPRYKELSKGYHQFHIDVGVMCSAYIGSDIHELNKLVGLYQSKMIPIDVKKFGNLSGDDQSYIGCLELRDDVDPSVDTISYGQTEAEKRLMQTSVEGFYELELVL
jgi:hypothetical protein